MPKISVIIPVYNTEKYLEKCVRSAMTQTLADLELICINDGSEDSSLQILEALAAEDSRIRIVSQENRGCGAARNLGLHLATGEYIHFMDSDDAVIPEAYEELYAFASENALDAVFCSSKISYEDEAVAKKFPWKKQVGSKKAAYPISSGIDMLVRFTEQNNYNPGVGPQLIRREYLLSRNIEFSEILHEDILYTFSVLFYAKRTGCLTKPYYLRTVRRNSLLTNPPTEKSVPAISIPCMKFSSYAELCLFPRSSIAA